MRTRTAVTRPLSAALPMTRGEFLRTLAIGVTGLAGGITGFGIKQANAQLAAGEVAVYPTGQFPFDVNEVSAAVNGGVGPSGTSYPGGGIVRLKATNTSGTPTFFNFGGAYPSQNRGTVDILKDVTVVGERISPTPMTFPYDPAPEADYAPDRTVVYGGKQVFRLFAAPVKLALRNIFFAYPSLAAVNAAKTAGLDIADCVIYDVKPDVFATGINFALGIQANGAFTAPDQLFGDFKVTNNRLRRASPIDFPPLVPFLDSGILLALTTMNANIVANEIDRFTASGVVIRPYVVAVTIAGNTVTRCGYGPDPTCNGICVRATSVPVVVERNRVTGGDAGSPSIPLPSKNGLTLGSSNVVVQSNTVDGTFAARGMWLLSYPFAGTTYFATDNRLEKNDLSELVAGAAQVSFDLGCDRNRFANNDYGSVGPAAQAGMIVQSSNNAFVNEDFWGTYSGIGGQPCVLLTATSSGNTISAFKYQGAPHGFDVCNQIRDEGTNTVNGSEKCK